MRVFIIIIVVVASIFQATVVNSQPIDTSSHLSIEKVPSNGDSNSNDIQHIGEFLIWPGTLRVKRSKNAGPRSNRKYIQSNWEQWMKPASSCLNTKILFYKKVYKQMSENKSKLSLSLHYRSNCVRPTTRCLFGKCQQFRFDRPDSWMLNTSIWFCTELVIFLLFILDRFDGAQLAKKRRKLN